MRGDEIPLASRIVQLAEYVEVARRVGGIEKARAPARQRAGKQFDPALAELLCRDAVAILDGLGPGGGTASEPSPPGLGGCAG